MTPQAQAKDDSSTVRAKQDEHREEQAWEAQSLDAQTTYEVIRREGVRL